MDLCASEEVMNNSLNKSLVQDLLTKYVFQAVVDTLSRPQYINTLICEWLKSEERNYKRSKVSSQLNSYRDLNGFIQGYHHSCNLQL